MPNLDDLQQDKFVKILYIGDSGAGKTGSLVSLVAAGYRLHILDLDKGLDSLVSFIRRECPDKLKNVDYETLRDPYKVVGNQVMIVGAPKAFTGSLTLMTKWSDGTNPAEWGPQNIFVLDSLSALGRAAFEWAKGMNPTTKDPRQWYGTAQKAVEDTISVLTSDAFRTNVIVISHVNMQELPDGTVKGFANSIGKAQGAVLPRYFNTLLLAETMGSGAAVRRTIKTVPTGTIDLKNPAPFTVDKELPLGTGLATIFEKLKENI